LKTLGAVTTMGQLDKDIQIFHSHTSARLLPGFRAWTFMRPCQAWPLQPNMPRVAKRAGCYMISKSARHERHKLHTKGVPRNVQCSLPSTHSTKWRGGKKRLRRSKGRLQGIGVLLVGGSTLGLLVMEGTCTFNWHAHPSHTTSIEYVVGYRRSKVIDKRYDVEFVLYWIDSTSERELKSSRHAKVQLTSQNV
jgi:hypothetical protein